MDFGSMLDKLKRDAQVASSAPPPPPPPKKRPRTDGGPSAVAAAAPSKSTASAKPCSLSSSKQRSFPTTPVRTVYLVCPPRVQTGGPEAMHQLCHALNTSSTFTGAARMLYLREDDRVGVRHARGVQRLPVYERYDAPAAKGLPGEYEGGDGAFDGHTGDRYSYSSDLVIWPECWTNLIDCEGICRFSNNNRTHQTAIWWLSVDNNNGKFKEWGRDDILHLHQSEYARRYLKDKGAKHTMAMTEYIPDRTGTSTSSNAASAATTSASSELTTTDLQVLYNPLKGIHYTDEIMRRSGRGKDAIEFTPIGGGSVGRSRISPEEVVKMLHRARIYIDFGPHPGMDRLPREAALAGCIVITNSEGAAQYDEDVPIPAEYKIRKFNVDTIHRLLRQSLDDESKTSDFDDYRKWIEGQADRMRKCVEDLVDEIVMKRSGK
mmetsp:Transcript_39085/g.85693  ORF Transcript_39085/g.85693 Transcript_39085/m.85693 type:complete len:434 (+) Transcript_39085:131-1432(+)